MHIISYHKTEYIDPKMHGMDNSTIQQSEMRQQSSQLVECIIKLIIN
jgi:hypothetical protein